MVKFNPYLAMFSSDLHIQYFTRIFYFLIANIKGNCLYIGSNIVWTNRANSVNHVNHMSASTQLEYISLTAYKWIEICFPHCWYLIYFNQASVSRLRLTLIQYSYYWHIIGLVKSKWHQFILFPKVLINEDSPSKKNESY